MSKRTIGILSTLSVMLALVGAGLIVAGVVRTFYELFARPQEVT
jgi:hypothetical protein